MEKWKRFSRVLLALLLGLTLGLAGCDDGDDGDRGPQGPEGPPGPPATETQGQADALVIPSEITNVSVPSNGQPTVTFTVKDQNGRALSDIPAADMRFIIAKLLPAGANEPPNWQSYINRTEDTAGKNVGPNDTPALASSIQATTENNGTLTNNGNGSYTYTFNTNLTNVTSPVAVAYEPNLTHRVAIQIEVEQENGPTLLANPTKDFIPAGGTPAQPQVVLTQQCNECHDLLVAHGGRYNVEYCVTCHNGGSDAVQQATGGAYNKDANSGNTIDFPVMVHRIHMGRELPSVAAGGEYAIWGFRDTKHDYSNVGYPQDIRHCTKCHEGSSTADEGEETAPQGDNWKQWPTVTNCTSCHDNISFVDPPPAGLVLHSGGAQPLDNSTCSSCHPPDTDGAAGANVTDAHQILPEAAAANFEYNLGTPTFDAGTRTLSVPFRVTNPRTGANYNVATNPAFTQGSASSLGILVGWRAEEFDNTNSGNDPAQPIEFNILAPEAPQTLTGGPDGYVANIPIPPSVDLLRIDGFGIALQGHPALVAADGTPITIGTRTGRVPVTNAYTTFPLVNGAQPAADTPAPARREIVSIDKCNVCHNTLSLHGNNRTNVIEVCAMCHNPNATDYPARQEATPVSTDETAIDFKTMIHGLHGNEIRQEGTGLVIYGFGGTAHEFGLDSTTGEAIRYPARLQNCLNCHVDDSYQLPLNDRTLATTIDTGADPAVPFDDINISPTSAVCFYCHNSTAAKNHMISNGGNFNLVGQAPTGTTAGLDPMESDTAESCSVCHGPGKTAAVDKVHFIEEQQPVPAPEPVLGPVPAAPENPAPPPTTPTADAGSPQTATVASGIQLDGSGSTVPAGATATYNWTIQQAPTGSTGATLTGADTPTPTFTPDVAGDYTIQLEVSDGTTTATDTVVITANPAGGGGPTPPATVVLTNNQGNILLDHAKHTTFAPFTACTQCHPSTPPGAFAATLNQTSGHNICRNCHVANGGPTACDATACHGTAP